MRGEKITCRQLQHSIQEVNKLWTLQDKPLEYLCTEIFYENKASPGAYYYYKPSPDSEK